VPQSKSNTAVTSGDDPSVIAKHATSPINV